ncbi:MAG: acyl-CoA dehydrogenase family protein, partial [Terriglobales bacterium]
MTPPPLTTLSSEEQLLRHSVRDWAESRVRPLVREMDEASHFDESLLRDFFRLG